MTTTINEKIVRAKELIAQREAIDAEFAAIFAGGSVTKKTNKCSICNEEGHSARTCPKKEQPKSPANPGQQSTPSPSTSFFGGIMKKD